MNIEIKQNTLDKSAMSFRLNMIALRIRHDDKFRKRLQSAMRKANLSVAQSLKRNMLKQKPR